MSANPPELERAYTLHSQGNLAAAEQAVRQLTQTHPGLSDPWMLLGVIQMQRGKPAAAVAMFQEVIKRDFTNAMALGNMGGAYLQLHKYPEADQALKKAVAIDPGMIEAQFNLGTLYNKISRPKEALNQFEIVLSIEPNHTGALINKGHALMDTGNVTDAEQPLRKVLKANPDDLKALSGLVVCLEKQNRLDESDEWARHLIKKHPQHPQAQITSGLIDFRQKRPEKAVETLSKVIASAPSDLPLMMTARFTLAKALNELERYDEAFMAFTRANELLLATAKRLGIDPATYRKKAAQIRNAQKNDPAKPGPAAQPGEPRQPIFFVGFPRSGTTLFEQMLAAHPDILTTGEKSPLIPIYGDMPNNPKLPCGDGVTECLNKLNDQQLLYLRDAYWKNLEIMVGSVGDKLLVDKMPLNFIHLPLAVRLFPEAKVIVALRDPRDALLSCFMQHFTTNDVMPNFTKLDSAAEVYDTIMGMWLELRESLPLKWIEFRYEDLVVDMEGTIGPVLDFIGVGWADELKSYREKAAKASISTPSYTTVGEALNTRATGRWRCYEKHLEPVLETLAPYIKEFGYEET